MNDVNLLFAANRRLLDWPDKKVGAQALPYAVCRGLSALIRYS